MISLESPSLWVLQRILRLRDVFDTKDKNLNINKYKYKTIRYIKIWKEIVIRVKVNFVTSAINSLVRYLLVPSQPISILILVTVFISVLGIVNRITETVLEIWTNT